MFLSTPQICALFYCLGGASKSQIEMSTATTKFHRRKNSKQPKFEKEKKSDDDDESSDGIARIEKVSLVFPKIGPHCPFFLRLGME